MNIFVRGYGFGDLLCSDEQTEEKDKDCLDQSVSEKIIKNTVFNAMGQFFLIVVSLLLTPYIVRHLGIERFGIWAIVFVVTEYFGLLDLGIGTSFIKYVAEFYARKDFEKINQIINTGFVFYSMFSGIILLLICFITDSILVLLNIPLFLRAEASFALMIGFLVFGISNALNPYTSILEGLQRMDLNYKATLAVLIPNVVGTIFVLESGYGLKGLLFNQSITVVLGIMIKIIMSFRILPQLKFNPFFFSTEMIKKLLKFGSKLQISRVAYVVNFQMDKLLITYFLGIGSVAFYQLGSSITQKMRQIPLVLVSALVPAVSEVEVRNGKESLGKVYLKGSKYLIFVSTPLLFFVSSNAYLIMLIWMGEGYENAALVIQILSGGYFAATVSGVASSIAVGVARTEFEMRYGLLMAPMNLFLSLILVIKCGLAGVVVGTSASLIFGSFYFLRMFHRYLNAPIDDFIRLFCKPVAACVLPTLLSIVLTYYFWPTMLSAGRVFNLSILIGIGILFLGLYLVCIKITKYFDAYDADLFKDRIPILGYLLG